ncbi:hypothetical protein [Zavarzinia aquatilis]|uniref:DUF304 domain-containing protein n=1 Tax=Zavarzinia aquatilis TaxID=2211142 RepID=A0A317E8K3_9PROT|nr:hypothetical protein [Zavarzinia aquatilis]PWR22882.1 hypothetical protein DKG74_10705 [Zavarzinia aquatilis]
MDRTLLAGERVLWEGQPIAGLVLGPKDFILIPFSLFWTGFAVFWNAMAWKDGSSLLFQLFGLPFLVVGFFILFGRFWADAYIRRRLFYRVTDQRVMIVRQGPFAELKSLDIQKLPTLELDERSDGRGTIRFGSCVSGQFGGRAQILPVLDTVPQFYAIENARAVFELIRQQFH